MNHTEIEVVAFRELFVSEYPYSHFSSYICYSFFPSLYDPLLRGCWFKTGELAGDE